MDTAIYSFAAVVTVLVAVQVTDRQPPRSWNNGFQSTRLQLWVWMTMCTFNQNSLPPPPSLLFFCIYIFFFPFNCDRMYLISTLPAPHCVCSTGLRAQPSTLQSRSQCAFLISFWI